VVSSTVTPFISKLLSGFFKSVNYYQAISIWPMISSLPSSALSLLLRRALINVKDNSTHIKTASNYFLAPS